MILMIVFYSVCTIRGSLPTWYLLSPRTFSFHILDRQTNTIYSALHHPRCIIGHFQAKINYNLCFFLFSIFVFSCFLSFSPIFYYPNKKSHYISVMAVTLIPSNDNIFTIYSALEKFCYFGYRVMHISSMRRFKVLGDCLLEPKERSYPLYQAV